MPLPKMNWISRRGKSWLLSLIPVALAIAVYWPVARFDFVDWDDWLMVAENPDFRPPAWDKVAHYWTEWRTGHIFLYVPLTYTTYAGITWVSLKLGGAFLPGVFHAANLLAHIVACLLVFRLLRALFKDDWPALAGATLFAVHPMQVEPVAWIASLNTVLSGMLGMLALWLYVLHVREKRPRQHAVLFILATLAAALAMLAKPAAVVVPLMALVIDWFLLQRPLKKVWMPVSIWLLLAIPIALIGRHVQPATYVPNTPIWARPVVALDTIAFYVGKIVAPIWLGGDYGRTPGWLLSSWQVWLSWLIPATLGTVAWMLRRKMPELLGGFALVVASIVPVLGLVPFEFQGNSTVADRYLYAGMLGAALVAASLVSRWPRQTVPFMGIVLALFAVRAGMQVWAWKDTPSLITNTLRVNPQSSVGHRVLGYAYARAGMDTQAIPEYRTALKLRPGDLETQYDLANALLRRGSVNEAAQLYEALTRCRSEDILRRVHNNYGVALMRLARVDDAGREFNEAIRLDPQSPEAWTSMGIWLEIKGLTSKAMEANQIALRLRPDYALAQRNVARLQTEAAQASTRPAQ